MKITSRFNGNAIFIPSTGLNQTSYFGFYWTNQLYNDVERAEALCFTKTGNYVGAHYRYLTFPIRPVRKEKRSEVNDFVDLGLPSGTLWAKCNIGANLSKEDGSYFAWGEVEPKEFYDWTTYLWCEGTENSFVKYCNDSRYGIVDNKTHLEKSDDAAKVWGEHWSTPDTYDFEELMQYCTHEWIEKNDSVGYVFRSDNGNSIFFPAAGSKNDLPWSNEDNGDCGYYWTNHLATGFYNNYGQYTYGSAYALNFVRPTSVYENGLQFQIGRQSRYLGLSIRPIVKNMVSIKSLSFDMTNLEIRVGDKYKINASLSPQEATIKNLHWTSSDDTVAKVENDGMVTAIAEGSAKITAITMDGTNLFASCDVTVKPKLANYISIDKTDEQIIIGNTIQFSATVLPDDIKDKSVTWESDKTSIASVDQIGLVSALNVGTAIIKATTNDGSNLSATCKVTVLPVLASSITLSQNTASLNVDETLALSAIIMPENATYKVVEWISTNEDVATVENGVVHAVSPGNVTISAKTTDGTNLEDKCEIVVNKILASSIQLDKTSIDLLVNENTDILASVLPENATIKNVVWTSSNPDVATVNNGKVTAIAEGTSIIIATTTDGTNLATTCAVKVSRHPQEIIWDQELSSVILGVELMPLTAYTSTGLPLVYTSSNENVATIFDFGDAIYLNAFAIGTTDITASQAGNDYYAPVSMTKTVNVIADPAGVNSVIANTNGKYSVYTINGLFVGEFTKDELTERIKTKALARGVYIVNGKKMIIK